MTEDILSINNLPDAQKKPTQAIVKKYRRSVLTDLSKLAERELALLNPDHSETLPERLKIAVKQIQSLRDNELKQKTTRKKPKAA